MDSERDIREKPSAGMNSSLRLCSLLECVGHTLSPLPHPPIMGLRETCLALPVLNRARRTVYMIQCLRLRPVKDQSISQWSGNDSAHYSFEH